jgi:histidine triad (HIT) family protein
MNESCLFCRIVAKEIPAQIVYENDQVLAFLDINPIIKGHVLLIPKFHCEQLLDLPAVYFEPLMAGAKRIAMAQTEALGADGVNWMQNSGAAAGQEIFHFHIHLIPRFVDDEHHWNWHTVSYGDELPIAEMATSIRKSIVHE